MNEQANVRKVQEMYAAFGRGDIEAVIGELTPDVEWNSSGPKEVLPFAGLRRGHDGVRSFFRALGETTSFESFLPQEFIAQGDQVVALGQMRYTVKQTGKAVEEPWAMVFTFRDGKVCRFREYVDSAAAVAAFQPS